MSILIQTTVLIMVIALITYSKLDLFLPKKALEKEIVNYMTSIERGWMNRCAEECYAKLRPGSKPADTGEKNEKPSPPTPQGTGKISLKPLFEESLERMNNTKSVLKNLLVVLYSKQPFVTNEIKKGYYADASILFGELIDAIIQAGKNLPIESRPTTEDQLSKLNLGTYQSIFVNIINGCSCYADDVVSVDETSDSSGDQGGTVIPRNYCSLFSFADMRPYKNLSVYLAPEQTLLAIYGNPQIVNELIQARNAAYKEYKNNKTPEAQKALERFKTVPSVIDTQFLDFNVTGTDPNRKRGQGKTTKKY